MPWRSCGPCRPTSRCCSCPISFWAAMSGASRGGHSTYGWGSATCTRRSRRPTRCGRGARSIGCWRLADALGREEVQRALAEDRATEDVTTRLLGTAARQPAGAAFVAEGRFVIAGLPIVAGVYSALERDACFEPGGADGEWVPAGTVLARVRATAGALLAGERVALNFLQRLSGIATLTRRAVE